MLATLGLLACLAALAPAGAEAAKKHRAKSCSHKGADYFTPGYKGICKAPKLGEQPVLPPVALGDNGRAPQVLVDNAGTAHIVWNQDGGDAGPDLLRYCRLKRGATACDNPPAAIAPDQPGPFNSPAFNDDIAGPRILTIADGLIFLTHRYPNLVPKPDMTETDRTTYMYTSTDGGTTITGPAIVGDGEPSGGAATFGDGSRIGLISDTRTGGTFFQAIDPGSYTSAQANLGGNGPDRAYSGSLASVGGAPIAAYADLSGKTYIRQFAGGNIADPGTWAEGVTSGVEPKLASGPAGPYLANSPPSHDSIQVRPLKGVQTAGNGVTIKTGPYGARDFVQDAGGALRLGWVDSRGKTPVLLESVAKGALKFDPGNAVARAPGLDQINLAATSDGGGFAVYTSGGSSQGFGKIFAAPFGNQAPTKLPGLGQIPGTDKDPGTTDACQEISYKAVQIKSPYCFVPVKGKPGFRVTTGRFKLNGLTIIPDAGVGVEMSTQSGAKTIDAVGGNAQVTVQLDTSSGPIVLWHGKLHIKLPTGAIGTKLFDQIDVGEFPTKIKGFPVEADFDIILKENSVEIPITLTLPDIFGGLTGSTTLKADNEHGLSVNSVKFGLKELSIGDAFVLSDVEVAWDGDADSWSGGASLKIVGAEMAAHVTFEKGEFTEGDITIPLGYPGVVLFTDVYLNSVDGGFTLKPNDIRVRAGALLGAQPLPPDTYVYNVHGGLEVTILPRFAVDFKGDGAIGKIEVSHSEAHADADGHFSVNGEAHFDFPALRGSGKLDAFFDTSTRNFGGNIDVTLTLGESPLSVDIGASASISPEKFGACEKPLGGFAYTFKTRKVDVEIGSCPGEPPDPAWCDPAHLQACVDALKKKAGKSAVARAAQEGPPNFTLPGGLTGASVQVLGVSGPPSVTLVSPSGARVTPVPINDPGAGSAPAVFGTNEATTSIGLRSPAGGNWKVEATSGTVAEIDVARELPTPSVKAKVRGHGRNRVLTYKTTSRKGLAIRFYEKIGRGQRQIRVVKGGRGKFRFVAGDGQGGKREIVAQAEQSGLAVLQHTVASYRAPGPIRPHVRGLKARRAGKKVVVRWRRAQGAKSYVVRFDVSDGRHLQRTTSRKKAKLGGIGRRDRVRVRVYGRSAHGRRGKPAQARVRAKRR